MSANLMNPKTERYCHKCHRIKFMNLFKTYMKSFRQSSVCNKCRLEKR